MEDGTTSSRFHAETCSVVGIDAFQGSRDWSDCYLGYGIGGVGGDVCLKSVHDVVFLQLETKAFGVVAEEVARDGLSGQAGIASQHVWALLSGSHPCCVFCPCELHLHGDVVEVVNKLDEVASAGKGLALFEFHITETRELILHHYVVEPIDQVLVVVVSVIDSSAGLDAAQLSGEVEGLELCAVHALYGLAAYG